MNAAFDRGVDKFVVPRHATPSFIMELGRVAFRMDVRCGRGVEEFREYEIGFGVSCRVAGTHLPESVAALQFYR